MAFTPGGGAVISIGADGTAATKRDIDSVGDSLRRLNDANFQKLNGQVGALQGKFNHLKSSMGEIAKFAAATISVGAFVGMIRGAIDAADNMNDLSKTTGIAIEDLSGLKLAAKQSGGELEGIADSINKLSTNMGKDAERFRRLGITARDPLEAFKQFADVFSAIQNPQMRAALGAEALGKSWQTAAPLLAEGGQKIGEMVAKGKALSNMTQEMADKADEFNDRMAEMDAILGGMKTRLAGDLVGGMTEALKAINQALVDSGKLQAVWVALGAVGSFAFTDEFSSAQVKIKNLREELQGLQTDLDLSKNAPAVGFVERWIFGNSTSVLEKKVADTRAQIKSLEDQLKQPEQAAAAASEKAAKDKAAAAAKKAEQDAADFVRAGEETKKAALAAQLEIIQQAIEKDKNIRSEGLAAVAELNREGLASDAQVYAAKYSAAIAAGADIARVKTAELATLASFHAMTATDQKTHDGKMKKLDLERTEAIRSSAVAADLIRKQYIFDSGSTARAAQAAADAEVDAANREVVALKDQYETYNKLPEAVTAITIAKLEAKAVALETNEGTAEEIANVNRLIIVLKEKAKWQGSLTSQKGGDLEHANQVLDVMTALDDAAQKAAQGMADSFGSVGTAIGGMSTALSGYAKNQASIAAQLAAARQDAQGDQEKINIAEKRAAAASAQAQIQQYGDVAHAASSFFSKNTAGYKVLHSTEQAFRAYEMAMAVKNMVVKSGLLTAFTGMFVTAKATETTAEVASLAPTVAVETAKQGVFGVTALAAALALPFPANLPAFAIVAAMLAAIGVAVGGSSGGSGGKSAEQAQKEQGTGSVFGDKNAKSESIAHSLSLLEQHSDMLVPINQDMLSALRNIESSIGGLTNLVVRTKGVTDASNMGIREGTISKSTGASIASGAGMGAAAGSYFGPIGAAIGAVAGAIIGGLKSIWGKTTQHIVDSGIQFGGTVGQLQSGQGYSQYASVDTTKSSWFGLKKTTSNSVQTQGLSNELTSQFALIFTNLESSLQVAAKGLGVSADQVSSALDSLKIETTSVSLKGLSGQDLTDALNAVISQAMDTMTEAVFPTFDKFRKVGEGYTETVMRLVSDYSVLDAALNATGDSFGAVGIGSIDAREHLIELAGGIDQLVKNTAGFAENYLTAAERLAPVQKYVAEQMAAMGLSGVTTREQFKQVVLGLDKTTEAGAAQYATLIGLQDAFAKVTVTMEDTSSSLDDIASERKSLQDELDQLTMTSAQLMEKHRNAINESNRALYDQVQAQKALGTQLVAQQSAYKGIGSALVDNMDKATAAAKALRAFNSELLSGSNSTLALKDRRDVAMNQFVASPDDTKAASAFLDASKALRDFTGDRLSYARDFAAVQTSIGKAANDKDASVAGMIAFWRSIQMDGSHANGLERVPFDGYRATLHKGERVLTAAESKKYQAGGDQGQANQILRELLIELRSGNRDHKTTATILQRVTRDGDSLVTAAA